jgi:hypothetical protein
MSKKDFTSLKFCNRGRKKSLVGRILATSGLEFKILELRAVFTRAQVDPSISENNFLQKIPKLIFSKQKFVHETL